MTFRLIEVLVVIAMAPLPQRERRGEQGGRGKGRGECEEIVQCASRGASGKSPSVYRGAPGEGGWTQSPGFSRNATTSSSLEAPRAAMTRRSTPRATPEQRGMPGCSRAVRKRSSGWAAGLPARSRARFSAAKRRRVLRRILQLVVAVRELESGPVDLETLRGPGIVVAQPGERRQRSREPRHDRRRPGSPGRVPRAARTGSRGPRPGRRGDPGGRAPRPASGDVPPAPTAGRPRRRQGRARGTCRRSAGGSAQEVAQQQVHFPEQSLERAQAVPLGDGELDGVMPAGLSRAKRLDHLEDGTASRRQQALHGELRRGVEEAPGRRHRVQMPIGRGVRSEDRGLDLLVAPGGQEGPQPGDERERSRRFARGAAGSHAGLPVPVSSLPGKRTRRCGCPGGASRPPR